ncbi:MAG: AraC family transcriptional regulator [Clostridiales bacterium]|nr:AraC family transcriptional regulator [Clostridiales bacterium]
MESVSGYTISQCQVARLPLGTYEFVIHYAEMLDENTAEFRHSHPQMELFYAHSGGLAILFDDEEVLINAGDLLIVPPSIRHHVQNIPGEKKTYFVLIFDFKPVKSHASRQFSDIHEIQEIDALLKTLPQDRYTFCPAAWDAHALFDQIYAEHSKKQLGWTGFTNMLYYGFFLHAMRHIVSISEPHKTTHEATNLAIEASKYIHSHYHENISLETLARHLHISRRHANRIFNKMFNTTFGKTLRLLRLTYAKRLLSTTEFSVEDIAEQVGLSSAQSLRKLFKQSEGITISQYRKRNCPGL